MIYVILILSFYFSLVILLYKITSSINLTFRISIILIFTLILILSAYTYLKVNNSKLRTVQISTTVSSKPTQINFNWGYNDLFCKYKIYRKENDSDVWGDPIAEINGIHPSFTDNNIESGRAYEYKIHKSRPLFEGFTFTFSGVNVDPPCPKKTILLLIDSSYKEELNSELNQLQYDLVGDGWNVTSQHLSRELPHTEVKKLIKQEYLKDQSISTIFILGHIAVPYSGNFAFDWHPNHKGAWPADSYYADINGKWTDSLINNTRAKFPANHNSLGDGKYDQSFITDDILLEIGRVDFHNLPIYNDNEIELTRHYLQKNHEYRIALKDIHYKGLIYDQFQNIHEKRANAGNGWRNFTSLFGKSNVEYGNFNNLISDSIYAFSYACGPGSFTSIGDFATSQSFVENNYQSVFTILFGSYFGDWNTENNLSRVALASNGSTLVTFWAGHPAWYFHHMALGKHIGFCGRISINNNGEYIKHKANRGVHMTILGDPSLRLHMFQPINDFSTKRSDGGVLISWNCSDKDVTEYLIYRSNSPFSDYSIISPKNLTATNYLDSDPLQGTNYYMIRAKKLQVSGSGSYFNKSQGIVSIIE